MSELSVECKSAFDKVNKLIEERKSRLGEWTKPDIHNLDSGILLQYFENWINNEDIITETENFASKKRLINILNNEKIEEVYLAFGEKRAINNYYIDGDKILIVLDGHIHILINETEELLDLQPFSATVLNNGTSVNVLGKSDFNYFLVIKLKSPLV